MEKGPLQRVSLGIGVWGAGGTQLMDMGIGLSLAG